jgi:DnaK suppressor protein
VKQRNETLSKIKERLLSRKSEMAADLSRISQEKVSDGQVQDSGDEALALTMQNLQDSLQQTEIDELRLIEEALMRIDKKEYGICVDCEEPIAERRLETFPYAARCIVCQEAFESA